MYYDLIIGALDEAARRSLENEMQARHYEYRSEFARRYFAQGREEGRDEGRDEAVAAARAGLHELVRRRLGEVPAFVQEQVDACASIETLNRWLVDVGSAADRDAVTAVFA